MEKNNRKGSFFLAWFFGLLIGVGGTLLVYGLILDNGPDMPSRGTVEATAKEFVSTNLLDPSMDPSIVINGEKSGVYEILVSANGEMITSYASKDGKYFFPVAYEMETSANNGQGTPEQPSGAVRTSKPTVELFVMSYCPYGLQAEKGIIPVVEAFEDSIDFELRFVNYAMHGEKEVAENTRQYCIQKTQEEKLLPYLKCFAETQDAISCGETAGITESMIDVCVKEADDEFNIAELYNNQSTWISGQFPKYLVDDERNIDYGVRGSPTLVINGVVTNSGRDSYSLMTTICDSFLNMTNACSASIGDMSKETPSPGFGTGTTSTPTDATC